MIKVLFFAQLRELLQCDTCEAPLPSPATMAGLRDYLITMNPTWAEHLSNQKILCARNQIMAKFSEPLSAGDEVAFFPPVTGG